MFYHFDITDATGQSQSESFLVGHAIQRLGIGHFPR